MALRAVRAIPTRSHRRHSSNACRLHSRGRSRPRLRVQRTEVSAAVEMNDTLLMGMRLTDEGVSAKTFEARFGTSLDAQFGGKLRALQDRGLVDWTPERARITPGGRLLANMVFTEFI